MVSKISANELASSLAEINEKEKFPKKSKKILEENALLRCR